MGKIKNVKNVFYIYAFKASQDQPPEAPLPVLPLCKTPRRNSSLIVCNVQTNLKPIDLWDDPVSVAGLLQLWENALCAAEGGGMGP